MEVHQVSGHDVLQAVQRAVEDLYICPNRIWCIAKSLPGGIQTLPQLLSSPGATVYKGNKEDHELCTFDFCERSRLDFTSVPQLHERLHCRTKYCYPQHFSLDQVENAVRNDKPTAWRLNGVSVLQPQERYMAISHVWSDGTGSGTRGAGTVNKCLFDFFAQLASRFSCSGLWWDTISIPTDKRLRSKALRVMHRNYERAAITVVHDCFLRNCEWIDAESARFAVIMSPWFSRGWTALELKMSQRVKVIFKGPDGPVLKDLDADVLELDPIRPTRNKDPVREAILKLRNREIADINHILTVLSPRHTSWPQDMSLISGLFAGIRIPAHSTQQAIYQEILQKVGKVSYGHLFHSFATMSHGYDWCPANLLDLPVTPPGPTLSVERSGNVFGKWDVLCLDYIPAERYIWNRTHPMIESKIRRALHNPDRHVLLSESNTDGSDGVIRRALLVRPEIKSDGYCCKCHCDYVGPVYFHPALTQSDFHHSGCVTGLVVHIGGFNGSSQGHRSAWAAIQEAKCAMESRQLEAEPYHDPQSPQEMFSVEGHSGFLKGRLIEAAGDGDADRVQHLLESNVNPDETDEQSWTALHHAVWRGHEEVVDLLLKKSDHSLRTLSGEQAIHLAAERGNSNMVKLLLESCDPHLPRGDGQTPLHLAARIGSTAVVELILAKISDPDTPNAESQTALHAASAEGHIQVVNALIAKNAGLNRNDRMGNTPLHLAVSNGHEQVARFLFQHGETIGLGDMNGCNLLHTASLRGDEKAVKLLLDLGANPACTDPDGKTPLFAAAKKGHEQIVRLLIKKGADPQWKDNDGNTPLGSAVFNNHKQVAQLLVQHGANPDLRDKRGQTLLHRASLLPAKEKAVKLLLDLGANPACTDPDGKTPLFTAVEQGHEQIAQLLIENGADPGYSGPDGKTPLFTAVEQGYEQIARLLIEKGADPGYSGPDGKTPLFTAVEQGYEQIARLLIEKGADPGYSGSDGKTPLFEAVIQGHEQIARLLIEKGADPKYSGPDSKLFEVAKQGNESIARLFIKKGADPGYSDSDSKTPLFEAIEQGHEQIARLLIEKRADPHCEPDYRMPMTPALVLVPALGLILVLLSFIELDA
ncbi:hypothetical protein HFD88_008309 [Aspergillus terreus]|nr:hypothetical protein HFD88_008309 [Aspergillus terreus]